MNIEKIEIEIDNSGHITNSYILYNDKNIIIVDPADKFDIFKKKIEDEKLNLKYVLLTHAHVDHILALYEILKEYDVKVIVNKKEKEMLEAKVNNCASIFALKQQPFNLEKFIFVDDGDCIDFDGISIKAISTLGHTAGSSCYYIEKEKVLFTGDTIFTTSFGRTDLPTGSGEDIINSIVKLFKNYSDCIIYPGHGSSNVKLSDIFDRINRCVKVYFNVDLQKLI